MATTLESKKACTVNPLKMSQPLGASYAFLGLDSCMPVMHGSQGCTSFGLVLFVRHFKEAIPLQTTAMNEVTTILGGYENIESALLNIRKRAAPRIIAICSTGLTETKGDDVEGYLAMVRKRKPELDDTALVYISTPDYVGAFEDGWRHAVTGIIKTLVPPGPTTDPRRTRSRLRSTCCPAVTSRRVTWRSSNRSWPILGSVPSRCRTSRALWMGTSRRTGAAPPWAAPRMTTSPAWDSPSPRWPWGSRCAMPPRPCRH